MRNELNEQIQYLTPNPDDYEIEYDDGTGDGSNYDEEGED